MNFIKNQTFKTKKGSYKVIAKWIGKEEDYIEFKNLQTGSVKMESIEKMQDMFNKKQIWL